ncbi:MAG: nucleotidyltransferase substrate binding protein [Gammaproteobacteria bacterium]|nr:nucleotidyltransferase substrate binding protein [Gammaproteobacteria bacterium]
MALNLSNLTKAINALEETLALTNAVDFNTKYPLTVQNAIKAGLIQHFEFTYELCWKILRRWIRLNLSPEDAEPRTKKELFRLAANKRLIQNPLDWFEYAEARNLTSHTYDEDKANIIIELATPFLADAQKLLHELELAND